MDAYEKETPKNSGHKEGEVICSLDELAEQEFIYFQKKLYHNGWFTSWQLNWCIRWMKYGAFRKAVKTNE